jgi:hypothetical protein
MAQTSVQKRALFERLAIATGRRVSAGEQRFLTEEDWAEEDLRVQRDDRFTSVLSRLRKAQDLDHQGEARPPSLPDEDPGLSFSPETPEDEEGPEALRALVLSREIGRAAGRREAVRDFRAAMFGKPGRVVSRRKAIEILSSPSLRLLRADELTGRGIRPDQHQVTIRGRTWGLLPRWEQVEMTIHWADSSWDVTRRVEWGEGNSRRLELPPGVDRESGRLVCEGSSLDHLRRAAHAIARGFGWAEGDAAWFLLTGLVRVIRPVTVATSVNLSNGEFQLADVTIRVQPFASPVSVASQFAATQRRLLGHRKGRPIEESNLHVFDFVSHRAAKQGQIPKWRLLMEEWNKAVKPRWRYKGYAAMRRDYIETRKRLLHPGFERGLQTAGDSSRRRGKRGQ